MRSVLPALSTELAQLHTVRVFALVLGRDVVTFLAFAALQRNSFSHGLSESEAIRFVKVGPSAAADGRPDL
jgi:hypothetical protein